MTMKTIKRYSELKLIESFYERYEYLKIGGSVGRETFGFDRYLNQALYRSREWKRVRDIVIARDLGCDLGIAGRDIYDKIIIHHMNPIDETDLLEHNPYILDPEFLITVSHITHNAIHYGDSTLLKKEKFEERCAYDTCPWKE